MAARHAERAGGPQPLLHATLLLSTAGLTAALTLMFLAMRSVMDVGGACGSDGTYVAAVECPEGVPLAILFAIFGGLISAGFCLWSSVRLGAPVVVWLAWPALFLSLGYNFWEYGVDPPFGEGVAVGWIVCGVVFVIMGGAPLLGALSLRSRRMPARVGHTIRAVATATRAATTPPIVDSPVVLPITGTSIRSASDPRSRSQVVIDLERLADLHRSGALTSDQFEAAKRALLRGSLS